MGILRKCIFGVFCLGVLLAVPALCADAQEISIDKKKVSPIAISNFKINKRSFKPGNTLKYSLTLTDTGIDEFLDCGGREYSEPVLTGNYGMPSYYGDGDTVHLFWKSSKKQYVVQSFNWKKSERDKKRLRISGKIPVQKGMQPGKWRLAIILIEYGEETFYVKNSDDPVNGNDPYLPTLDLSMADFKVSKTKADNKAPTIDLKSFKLSKYYVGKKDKSTFSVKIKDKSKVVAVRAMWDIYDKTNKGSGGDYYNFYKMTYNKKTKRWQCSIKLDTKYERKAQLKGIRVRDIYGNEKNYFIGNEYGAIPKKKKQYYTAYKKMVIRKK
ncbi:MAG: hypothetical protein K2L07_02750 [Lachnospiraceae bacterium]|nr:hypothetical protein [Lachnospiraceae bacterium]